MEILDSRELWNETLGDSRICIAVLDGPVDLSHPSFATVNLTQLETLVPISTNQGPALVHGTHIASIIFGQHDGLIKGIAPGCRGLVIPVFKDGINGEISPCSQLDLARAITQAMQAGAHIINISGGELSPSGAAHPILANVIQKCAEKGVLIVAATGNDGCDCLHIPGALPAVLAVGAMNAKGQPMDFSNWGESYQTQGVLAPGENILGAKPGGGTIMNSGTSYATPFVSGIAALLLSIQLKRRQKANPGAIRKIILSSAVGCDEQPILDCRRLLTGRLNIKRAITQITNGEELMSDSTETQKNNASLMAENSDLTAPLIQTLPANVQAAASDSNNLDTSQDINLAISQSPESPTNQESVDSSDINDATCETCAPGGAPQQLVFALGQLGFEFGTEARRDSIMQHMDEPANPNDPTQLLAYLEKNPWDAASIIWTLNLDATPIYAIQGLGAFASEMYRRFCEFLDEQTQGEVERISIPGGIAGSVQLSNGQIVPLIWPELRGMYSWNTKALVEAVCGASPHAKAKQEEIDAYVQKVQMIQNFLQRVYEELRNLGTMPQERAINYAATNVFQVAAVFKDAIEAEMDLDTIEVERSPICRPESDCWDVKLTFFNSSKVFEQARKTYLFTADVSDVVPVMVGAVRSWFVR